MYGYIYLTTNLVNEMKYIGRHKSEKFDESYKGSGKILVQAINKYGFNNFTCEIIRCCDTLQELCEAETYYIELYDAVNSPSYYNLIPGGLGNSESNLIYITNGTENRKIHADELEYYLSIGFHRGGPKPTPEAISKRAKSNTGKSHPTAGSNISKALTGKKLSDAHKQSIRLAKVGKPSPKRKQVECVETHMIFACLSEATAFCNGKTNSAISLAIKNDRTAFGYHWRYVK